ncbi:MAG: hypothetical protein J5J00_11120 [Deltaproteobacteria bacterium]|nr:hypothetical protein [Deltaproteobacteria bacterium]
MRTLATSARVKVTPKNESDSFPGVAKILRDKIDLPLESKNSSDEAPAISASLKTAPNPETVAGSRLPGITNSTSTTLVLSEVKILGELNAAKAVG